MALNTPRAWLITYDITDPRRLVRLHRFLVRQATPVQYSVFHFEGSAAQMGRLMADIALQAAFVPEATWLLTRRSLPDDLYADCGTIQGLAASAALGAIQNVGITPDARGLGLGRALVLKSLHGFRAAGLRRVYLEVTAENTPAVELYRSVGFRVIRTMYKAGADTPAGVA